MNTSNIRQAKNTDISRIAEILIFTKRSSYRHIFKNDIVSFGEMQVLPLAKKYIENLELLDNIWVFDDEFVKGMITLKYSTNKDVLSLEIDELYVDTFFQHDGIGKTLMNFAMEQAKFKNAHSISLWVLEKNANTMAFYEKVGFQKTNERKLESGTL